MKRDVKMFVLGALAAFTGSVVAQTPTIFNAIRVLGTSELRGAISSSTGDVTVNDNLVITGTCTGCDPSFPVLAPNGSGMAPSYSFTNDADSGMWFDPGNGLRVTADSEDGARLELGLDGILVSGLMGGVTIQADDILELSATTAVDIDGPLTLQSASGTSGQVLTSNGMGMAPTWETGGASFPLLAPNGSFGAPSYSFANLTDGGIRFSSDFGNELFLETSGMFDRLNVNAGGILNLQSANNRVDITSFADDVTIDAADEAIVDGASAAILRANSNHNISVAVGGTIDFVGTSHWAINSDPGGAGECLKSQGAGSPPIWTTC